MAPAKPVIIEVRINSAYEDMEDVHHDTAARAAVEKT